MSAVRGVGYFRDEAQVVKVVAGIEVGPGEDDGLYVLEAFRTEQLGREELPVEGEIFMTDDENVRMEFGKTVDELYGISVADDGVFLKARAVGDGARKTIIFS